MAPRGRTETASARGCNRTDRDYLAWVRPNFEIWSAAADAALAALARALRCARSKFRTRPPSAGAIGAMTRAAPTIHRVGVPVVSVGNITLGGTGKTPVVEWLARWFGERGVRVALVSRGYGAKAGRPNDEALELAEKLPGVPHVLDRRSRRGARRRSTSSAAS